MPITIRPAHYSDIITITEIYAQSVLNGVASYELSPPSSQEMEARMTAITNDGYPFITAIDDETGNLLGYAYASAFRSRPAYQWLVENSVYLSENSRGMGLGKRLLLKLIEICEPLGFRSMVAVIGGASPASIALHKSCGFSEAGRLTSTGFKHGCWLDTVFMERPLGEGNTSDPLPLCKNRRAL